MRHRNAFTAEAGSHRIHKVLAEEDLEVQAVASVQLVAYILDNLEPVDTVLVVALEDSLADDNREADIDLVHLAAHHMLDLGPVEVGMIGVQAIDSPKVQDWRRCSGVAVVEIVVAVEKNSEVGAVAVAVYSSIDLQLTVATRTEAGLVDHRLHFLDLPALEHTVAVVENLALGY